MALNFSTLVYLPNFDVFARDIVVTPLASQPGGAAYGARGIYDTRSLDVLAMDGSIFSDQQTILDVRETEFDVLPAQGDLIDIPPDGAIPEAGMFEVVDANTNGGGETTLVIRKVVPAKP